MDAPHPPRSLLYVPASRPAMLRKLPDLAADAFVVDLEDGIAPAEREEARASLADGWPFGVPRERLWLRVNVEGDDARADRVLAGRLAPSTLVLPKAETPAGVREAAGETRSGLALTIETAAGVAAAVELAALPGVTTLIVGSADLRRSLRAPAASDREWERHALDTVLLAARAAGRAALDGVYFRFRDGTGLEEHATLARRLGYDGKSCIHPAQIETIHRVFSPTDGERRWAGRILEAWSREDGDRRGVVVVDGEMIEALHVDLARRIAARAGEPES